MSDAWQVLGLDGATATERDVKSAYARLLRQHRPDQDPEGFQKVRQAYEAALAILAGKESSSPSPLASIPIERQHSLGVGIGAPQIRISPGGWSPSPQPPSHLEEAIIALRASIASRVRQRVRESLGLFDKAAAEAGLGMAERSGQLLGAFGKDLKLLAEICTDDWLLQHATEGDTALSQAILGTWKSSGEIKRIQDFALALQRKGRHLSDASGATLMMQVACVLGRWQPKMAVDLAHKAFPHLPPDQRDALNQSVDNEVALGQIFEGFPDEHRTFWFRWIEGGSQSSNWRDSYSRQMLHALMTQRGRSWPGFNVLQRFMAPQAWQDLVSAIKMYYG